MNCNKCFFLQSYSSGYKYCNARYTTINPKNLEDCIYFIQYPIKCYFCNNIGEYSVTLKNGKKEIICGECEAKDLYNLREGFKDIHIESPETILKIVNNRKKKDKITKLSKKEMSTLQFIKNSNNILVRSLDNTQKGCLGKLIREGLVSISTTKIDNHKFKVAMYIGE